MTENPTQLRDENLNSVRGCITGFAEKQGITFQNVQDYRFINVTGVLQDGTAQCRYDRSGMSKSYSYGDLRDFFIISAADYEKKTGESVTLADDEALVLTSRCSYVENTITLSSDDISHTWRVKTVQSGSIVSSDVGGVIAQITLVVNDASAAVADFPLSDESGNRIVLCKWIYNFDNGLDSEAAEIFIFDLLDAVDGTVNGSSAYNDGADRGYSYIMASSREESKNNFYSDYSALFFIGIMLTLVFMLAAVLILYYKQISEGYEDQKRFEIMQKVGMTKKEIRRSINSQLLTVFFLPLLLAGVHLAFAFPMTRRLLELFSLYNVGLFVTTTLVSFGVFALLYTIVYRLTAKAYYNIVSA